MVRFVINVCGIRYILLIYEMMAVDGIVINEMRCYYKRVIAFYANTVYLSKVMLLNRGIGCSGVKVVSGRK